MSPSIPAKSTESKSVGTLLGQRLEELIFASGYSHQSQFADSIDVSRGTISKILSGSGDPRLSTIEKIAQGLDVPVQQLLTGPSATNPATTGSFHHRGRPSKTRLAEFLFKIAIPLDSEPPPWLAALCKDGLDSKSRVKGLSMRGRLARCR